MSDKKRQVVNELHKSSRINFKRRKVIIKSLNDLFQADLADLILYAKENDNYKYILVVINCFSKFLWAIPLKNKTSKEVCQAMERVFKEQTPINLQTDAGTEFKSKDFSRLTQKYKINHYQVYSEKKASIAERVIRTLKNMIWKEFSYQGHYNWTKNLQNIVRTYNNRKHRTIGMKPAEVTKKDESKLLNTVYNRIKLVDLKNQKFKVGDAVRISKLRGVFAKKYLPNWSTEVFRVNKVRLTNPITYLLIDERGQEILGGFYQEQLQRVQNPDIFLVEKILKKKGNQIFVKWLGFDNTHNSWIDKKDIV